MVSAIATTIRFGLLAATSWSTGTVLAFDTVSETFRRMARPPPLRNGNGNDHREFKGGGELSLCLLEMDGMVAVAAILGGSMDVWVLQDYDDDESWARHRRFCKRVG